MAASGLALDEHAASPVDVFAAEPGAVDVGQRPFVQEHVDGLPLQVSTGHQDRRARIGGRDTARRLLHLGVGREACH